MVQKPVVGIAMGTTHFSVGVWQDEQVEIIANERGKTNTPAYVAFTDTKCLIGESAKLHMAINPSNTIYDASYLLGHNFSDEAIQNGLRQWPFKVIKKGGDKPHVSVQYKGETKEFRPEEMLSMILVEMKRMAGS